MKRLVSYLQIPKDPFGTRIFWKQNFRDACCPSPGNDQPQKLVGAIRLRFGRPTEVTFPQSARQT